MTATAIQAPAKAPTLSAARKEMPSTLPLMERSLPAEDFRLIKGDDGFTRLTFSCSSETRVPRWYGDEILSHESSAVRLDRVKRGAVMLLFNHDMDDPVGVVTDARIEKRRLVVDVKLFKTARAAEIEAMIDGGMRNVSLMYRIHVSQTDEDEETYTIIDWEPFEVSVVTIPADPTVGIGRSQEAGQQFEVRMVRASSSVPPVVPKTAQVARGNSMDEQSTAAAGSSAERNNAAAAAAAGSTTASRGVDGGQRSTDAVAGTRAFELEQERSAGINNLCRANNIPDNIRDHWISSGASMHRVSDEMLRIMQERGKTNPKSETLLGLTQQETRRFSVRSAILAVASQNWNQAGFEAECSAEIAKRLGKVPETNKFYVPYEIQQRNVANSLEQLVAILAKRDLTVATAGAGGYLVETQNMGFIDLLRNSSVMYAMGATRLTGLQGNVTIPKQSAAGTAYWLSTEATAITESQQTFVQVAMSPKNVGGYTEISRQLLLQSNPSAEGLVMGDLAQVVGLAIDLAGLSGTGSGGQPTGITATSGIGSVTGTSITYAGGILEFLTDTFGGNALFDNSGFVTTAVVAALLMGRVKFTSTASPIWEGKLNNGSINGYRAMASNQVATGNLLFGDFSKTVIGEWGVLEIEVNPFANFPAGIVGVRAMASVDVAVRYPTAYSLAATVT